MNVRRNGRFDNENNKRNENGIYDWFASADELANNFMHTKYNIHREELGRTKAFRFETMSDSED